MLFVLVCTVTSARPEEYNTEFNKDGQTCYINDTWYFVNQERQLLRPSIYKCCFSNQDCEEIIFDGQNARNLNIEETTELYNGLYIKSIIDTGKISAEAFSLEASDGVCSYYGFDVVEGESVNLAAETEPLTSHIIK